MACMKSSFEKTIIISGIGLAFLALFSSTALTSNTNVFSLFCSSLSLVLFLLVYYLLNRRISRDITDSKHAGEERAKLIAIIEGAHLAVGGAEATVLSSAASARIVVSRMFQVRGFRSSPQVNRRGTN